jgi:hypothetical protein
MKKLTLLLAFLPMLAGAREAKIASPNGALTVTVSDEGSCATYAVALNGQAVVLPSALGFKANFGDFTSKLTITDEKTGKVSDTYQMRQVKQSTIHYEASTLIVGFENQKKQRMSVEFFVKDNDVAFRYVIPRQKKDNPKCAVIKEESTAFRLPDGTTTFICPQIDPLKGWERTKPSYEEEYTPDASMAVQSKFGQGYTFPCLFKTPQGWVIISETGTDGNYVGCALKNDGGAKYSIDFPQASEMDGWGTPNAKVALPALTPWRTMTIGTTLAPIVETTVANDLVQPKYKASKDYTYGKGTWSWIIRMDGSCNYKEQKEYIDFSAALGYRSVLVDAHWDSQIGYDKVAELSRYAQSKGVGLFLWYNSNGFWNDAPQGPRHKMNKSSVRRQEMKWMQENGILGIKVDFFGGDKQVMMQLYEDILTDANEFGLQCIFHGCTLPRGWERMYPNYVASEAVLASENLSFGQGACDAEAKNGCTHVFIRNTVASMDWGGSALNKRYSTGNDRGTYRRTSDVYALATAVLFQSSVQHFALAPNNLEDAPAWAIDFMKQVPTNWDEVRFIDGYPGKYAIIARRAGDTWYIAGINAEKQPVKKVISLPMFVKDTQLTVYADDAKYTNDPNVVGSVKTVKQNKKQQMNIVIPENGGIVIVGKTK